MNQPFKVVALLLIATFSMIACQKNTFEIPPHNQYSFFVAGHTYGQPGVENIGLYTPFRKVFPFLNSITNLKLGILTGDVVDNSTTEKWDAVHADLQNLNAEVKIAPGNHDLYKLDTFIKHNGPTYQRFYVLEDLYIILSPFESEWNIDDQQLSMFHQAISENSNANNHIFLFMHHPVWTEEDNKYMACMPNSYEGKIGESNFWTDIFPILDDLPNQVVLFAGDYGAVPGGCSITYDKVDNVQIIGSGMGAGEKDNIVIVFMQEDGSITFELIALNGDDLHSLGNVQDYWIQ